ncbi:MAG TPA: hypothetical protein VM012_05990 [Flavitalea sp.]|nr:hypothetical protein [Flavitalea sp.]
MMKVLTLLLVIVFIAPVTRAQSPPCVFKPPLITIHFGAGNVRDVNVTASFHYERIPGMCPQDGYYAYASYTSDCFSGDWHTLKEDHTPGDANGNMMLVNASHRSGTFLQTTLTGLKSNTTYEFAAWLMNLCKPSEKCPFPLLPDITFRLQTPEGKNVVQLDIGEVPRDESPRWKRHEAVFTTPPGTTMLTLIMMDNNPGGCGNDFALDDITFRECVKPPPVVKTVTKTPVAERKQPPVVKQPPVARQPAIAKPAPKKVTTVPEKKQPQIAQVITPQKDSTKIAVAIVKPRQLNFPVAPPVLRSRENTLVKQIETVAGEIKIDLYDNGEIDGDTVSIYHNNVLLMAHARLSQKPVTLRIALDKEHPHHELIMVAENLGSIPPNTSLMIVTAGANRYEVFISSTEQRNAKVILNLKE